MGRAARRGVAGDILRDWKAPRSADEVVGLMAVELAAMGGLDGVGRGCAAARPAPKKEPQSFGSIRRLFRAKQWVQADTRIIR